MSLLTILIILLVVAAAGGFWGGERYGALRWSPLGALLLIILVLFLTGNLHGLRLR